MNAPCTTRDLPLQSGTQVGGFDAKPTSTPIKTETALLKGKLHLPACLLKGSWVLFRFVPGQLHSREVVRIWERSRPSPPSYDLTRWVAVGFGSVFEEPPTRHFTSDPSLLRGFTSKIKALSYGCHEQGRHEDSVVFAGRQNATSAHPGRGLWSGHCNENSRAKAASRAHGMIGKRTVSRLKACCLVLPCSTAAGRAWTVLPSHKPSRPLRDVAGRTAASVIRPCGGQH